MRYLSVCSGIEAATVAWRPLKWEAVAFAEIEKFPAAVLNHHYPSIPNLGDMTQIKGSDFYGSVDLLVGGTPCQSFSVAGLRGGLDDARGQLTLSYFRLAGSLCPKWLVWENIPGVLSDDKGRTFGSFLGALAELGYGFAYRVLDAQHLGVPQRRRRVFLVGHLGDWRPAAAVLFERHSLSGDTPPGRSAGTDLAGTLTGRFGRNGGAANDDIDGGRLIAQALTASKSLKMDPSIDTFIVAHTLRGEGFDASEDGTGRANLIPINLQVATRHKALGERTAFGVGKDGAPAFTLSRAHCHGVYTDMQPIAFQESQTGCREYDTAGTLRAGGPGHDPVGTGLRIGSAVRRLTPRECERLQGFPDDYTLIPYRGKPAKDGPRYKAIGNSMAVPVMRWIGRRIDAVEKILAAAAGQESIK